MSATPSTERAAVDRPTLEPLSFGALARQPRWIAALLLALAVAAGFGALGQWQIGRAVDGAVSAPAQNRAVPIAEVDRPQTGVTGLEAGRLVEVEGALAPRDTVLLPDRFRVGTDNPIGGQRGWWVVGHLRTAGGASLAVALGWAPDRAAADAARERIGDAGRSFAGRYLPPDSPDSDDPARGVVTALAPAALVNRWQDPGPTYSGYLVADRPVAGLERIVAPAPDQQASLNLINVFYALEWALFAGFAVYLWYRLVKDAVERRQAEIDDAAAASGAGGSPAERL